MSESFKEKVLSWLLTIVVIISTLAIAHGDTTLAPAGITKMIPLLNYMLFGAMMFLINWRQALSFKLFMKIILAMAWFMFTNFNVATGTASSGMLAFLLMFAFAFCEDSVLLKAISYFRKYMVVISCVGIIACLDFFVIHLLPHTIVHYYSGMDNIWYVNYYLSYIVWYGGAGFRLCGMFNEPGIFGTTIALLLIVDRFNFKKPSNIILLVAACLTYSMACFSLLIVAGMLYAIKSVKYMLVAITIMVAAMAILPQVENKNVQALVERFEFNSSTGKMKGDNRRSSAFQTIEQRFGESSHKLLGMGTGYLKQQSISDYSSYKTVIIEWGYLGFALTALLFLFASLITTEGNKDAIVFWTCAALTLYSRNQVYTVYELFLMYGGGTLGTWLQTNPIFKLSSFFGVRKEEAYHFV